MTPRPLDPRPGDALFVVHVQRDFLRGGSLPVPDGDAVIPVLNRYLALAAAHGIPVLASRDWHPPDHRSFRNRGGPWPVHCVAGTWGAGIDDRLELPDGTPTIDAGFRPDLEGYSAFEATGLARLLRRDGIHRLWIGGLATDFCVLHTTIDALLDRFEVALLTDAIRAIDATSGADAVRAMTEAGAVPVALPEPAG